MCLTCPCGKTLTSRSGFYSHVKTCTVKERVKALEKELAETKQKLIRLENQLSDLEGLKITISRFVKVLDL